MSRYWFVPRPGYDGPAIELVHGHWTASGKFVPRNVKLSPQRISRLSKKPRTRLRMAGDPSTDEHEIYAMHMREKRARKVRP
jgi:hypothetical protein